MSVTGPEGVDRVMAALEREADLDGIAIVTSFRLGELAGLSPQGANWAVHRLAEAGRVAIAGRAGGPGADSRNPPA